MQGKMNSRKEIKIRAFGSAIENSPENDFQYLVTFWKCYFPTNFSHFLSFQKNFISENPPPPPPTHQHSQKIHHYPHKIHHHTTQKPPKHPTHTTTTTKKISRRLGLGQKENVRWERVKWVRVEKKVWFLSEGTRSVTCSVRSGLGWLEGKREKADQRVEDDKIERRQSDLEDCDDEIERRWFDPEEDEAI